MRWLGHIGAAAVSAFFIAPIVFMAADREPPVIRHAGEFVPPDPHPGGRVSVVWHTTIKRICPGVVQRRIIDSTGTIWTLGMVEAEYGRGDELIRSFTIPFGIAWGKARYTATTYYRCNVLQDYWPIVVEGPAVSFNVVPREGIIGPQGPAGPVGATGAQGVPGEQGPAGAPCAAGVCRSR